MSNESKVHEKYEVNIEGTDYPWSNDTITPEQIRELGHLPAGQPVLQVDLKTNEEMTLVEGVPVELKPGQGFARKVQFKRGN